MAKDIMAHISPSEYVEGVRRGFMGYMASRGVGPSELTKLAQARQGSSTLAVLTDILKTSALAGVPLGALWYLVDNAIGDDNAETKKLKAQRKFYRDYAAELRRRGK